MALDKKNNFNLLMGLVLTTLVTLPTFMIVFGDAKQPALLPNNAWLWPTLWILLLSGWFMSVLGLMRKVHWGYFLWSQTILSFFVLLVYIGQYRADRDYARFGPDPDAMFQGPPEVSWARLLFLVLMWLVVGLLPMVLMYLWRRHKVRKAGAEQK